MNVLDILTVARGVDLVIELSVSEWGNSFYLLSFVYVKDTSCSHVLPTRVVQ